MGKGLTMLAMTLGDNDNAYLRTIYLVTMARTGDHNEAARAVEKAKELFVSQRFPSFRKKN